MKRFSILALTALLVLVLSAFMASCGGGGGASPPVGGNTDNGNGTITDNVTTLVWQKQDDAAARTWADAITYCDNLTLGGQTDWRLPSRIELVSL